MSYNPFTSKQYTYEDFKPIVDSIAEGVYSPDGKIVHDQQYWNYELNECQTAMCISGIAQSYYEPDTIIDGPIRLVSGDKEDALLLLFFCDNFSTEQVVEYYNNIQEDGSVVLNDWTLHPAMLYFTNLRKVTFNNCFFELNKFVMHREPEFKDCVFNDCVFLDAEEKFTEFEINTFFSHSMFINCQFDNTVCRYFTEEEWLSRFCI